MALSVKVAVDLPLIPCTVWTSTVKLTVIPIKAAKDTAMPKEKNSVTTNNRKSITRKDKLKEKNSSKQKSRIKEQKRERLWMPIGWINLLSDMWS